MGGVQLMAKRAVGRPRKIQDVAVLQERIAAYFAQGETDPLFRPIITGLVIFCGYVDRNSFYEMEKRIEFRDTIKKARTLIEACYERRLHSNNPVGAIFALKNFGWRDTPEVVNPGAGQKIIISVNLNGEKKDMPFEDLFKRPSVLPEIVSNGH